MAAPDEGGRLGPIELLVIEFPLGEVRSEGFATLTDLVERGVIAVLDLQFVRSADDGTVERVSAADAVGGDDGELGYLAGASSGLIGADDIGAAGASIEPGVLAGVLLLEHTWILPLIDQMASSGARVVRSARVDPAQIVAARDRLRSEDGR
ncbi:MAG: DUF6325 family protein [Dermatophilaceae bacterium]